MRIRRWMYLYTVLALSAVCHQASAQSYPDRPVRILVGFPAGGGVDIVARIVARPLSAALGQPVIVENRPGASGNVASEILAKSPADGYTLMLANTPQLVINPTLYPALNFRIDRDITPIARVSAIPFFAIVSTTVPVNSLQELVAYSKQNPDKLFYATAGSGSVGHLGVELFKSLTGARLTHVPYKGAAPALQDLVAGQVQFTIDAALLVLPHVQSGRLKVLAVADSRRDKQLPNVPTAAEAGVPGLEVAGWQAMVGPPGLSPAVVQRLAGELSKIMASAEVKDALLRQGVTAWPAGPDEFTHFLQSENVRWSDLVKATGARVD